MKNICFEGLFSGSSEDIDSDIYIDRLLKEFNSASSRISSEWKCSVARIEGKALVIGLPEYGDVDGGLSYLIGAMRMNALTDFMRDTGIRKIRFESNPNGCDAIRIVGDSADPISLGGATEIEAGVINLTGFGGINDNYEVRLKSKLVVRPEYCLGIKIGDETEIMNIVPAHSSDMLEKLDLEVYTKNGYLSQDCIDWINKYKNIKIRKLNLKFFHRGVSSNIMSALGKTRFITQESLEEIIRIPGPIDNIISLGLWVNNSKSLASRRSDVKWKSFILKRQGGVNWNISRH